MSVASLSVFELANSEMDEPILTIEYLKLL